MKCFIFVLSMMIQSYSFADVLACELKVKHSNSKEVYNVSYGTRTDVSVRNGSYRCDGSRKERRLSAALYEPILQVDGEIVRGFSEKYEQVEISLNNEAFCRCSLM